MILKNAITEDRAPPRRAHQYVFKIYALDILLNPDPNLTKKGLEKAMEGHILYWAQLKGVYKRNERC